MILAIFMTLLIQPVSFFTPVIQTSECLIKQTENTVS